MTMACVFPSLSPPAVNFVQLYPPRREAVYLWRTYFNNVDPFVKILHIPTIEPTIYAAINNPESIAPDISTLLFAIYLSATLSILSIGANAT
jgi:hypothetical protein